MNLQYHQRSKAVGTNATARNSGSKSAADTELLFLDYVPTAARLWVLRLARSSVEPSPSENGANSSQSHHLVFYLRGMGWAMGPFSVQALE